MILYLRVGPQRGEARLLFHCITESVILEQILSGIQSEVKNGAEDDQLDQAPKPARSALLRGRETAHH